MTRLFALPKPFPWDAVAGPLAAAEDVLGRLDERLSKSPIREGWIARTHFSDAVAALWIEGELVDLEDLVLHDSRTNLRAPTHALTRAHAILRTRRRIFAAEPGWAASLLRARQKTRAHLPVLSQRFFVTNCLATISR